MFEKVELTPNVTLYRGDCLEVLPTLDIGGVDLVLADIPYGTTACKWDVVIPLEPMWEQLKRVTKKNGAIVLFGSQPFTSTLVMSNLKMFKYEWIWIKERPTNILQIKKRAGKNTENISVFYEGQCVYNPQKTEHGGKLRTNKIKNGSLGKLIDSQNKKANAYRDDRTRYPLQTLYFQRDILKSNLHPTQKPVALCEYLIKTYTNEGETVLDFTMGSGTTGVASIQTGRRFIGIEIDKEYFDIAVNRISKALEQPRLFSQDAEQLRMKNDGEGY